MRQFSDDPHGRGEHCSPAKKHKKNFLIEFFSLVRKERKGQKEERIPLLNSFCRLAATSANKVRRPSHYSIVTATGSKRSSADSDSLLCHVKLRRTSRFEFGCGSGCEHGEMGFVSAIYCSNTSSAAVNRATFLTVARSRSGSDSPQGCHSFPSRRFATHWRRLARCLVSLKTKLRMPAFDNFHRMSKYKNVYEIWLMGLESLLQWEKVAATG